MPGEHPTGDTPSRYRPLVALLAASTEAEVGQGAQVPQHRAARDLEVVRQFLRGQARRGPQPNQQLQQSCGTGHSPPKRSFFPKTVMVPVTIIGYADRVV